MSISFEGSDRMTPETVDERVISEAFVKAESHRNRDRIRMEEFAPDYMQENVQKDVAHVEEMEKNIREESTPESQLQRRLGVILEEIFSEQIEQNEWLGPGVKVLKSSRFDDLVNGVDEIVEMESSLKIQRWAIAIDVTHGTGMTLEQKFLRMRQEIEKGTLAKVKYFRDPQTGETGLRMIPRVVIGVDKERLIKLASLWVENKNTELGADPVQLQILEEIKIELEACRNYAKKKKLQKIETIYKEQIETVNAVLESTAKKELRQKADMSYRESDAVYTGIQTAMQNLSALEIKTEKKYVPFKDRSRNPWMYQ